MPAFDFDTEYSLQDDVEEATDQFSEVADRAIADALGSAEDDEDDSDDSYMNEVDMRLEVTSCYRVLLRGSLFEQKTQASKTVEREVRRFVMQRIKLLLGITKPETVPQAPAALPFSEKEIMALRMFAEKLLATPSFSKPETEPELRKAQAPEEKPAPVVNRRPLQAPQVTHKPAPQVAQPTVAQKPTTPQTPPPAPKQKKKASPKPAAVAKTEDGQDFLEREVPHPTTGVMVKTRVPRIQRPAGQVPFPSSIHEMNALITSGASQSAEAAALQFETLLK